MLRALLERGITPDLVVGSSVGALNGLAVAADPSLGAVERLTETWMSLSAREVFASSLAAQVSNLVRHGTHLHGDQGLRRMVEGAAGDARIEDLPVPFQCVAASVERAGARWFSDGPIVDAVLASCAVPGLLPPVQMDGEHYMDGGLVASVPVGRAVDLGASCIFVIHVGRLERPLTVPRRPWEVAMVAFEIARRHQLVDELARLPAGIDLHVLPTGSELPQLNVRYRSPSGIQRRIDAAYEATCSYLERAGL
jgi:NTE family protein